VTAHSPDVETPARRLSAEERRAAIEAAAVPVFAEHGFRGASTAEIAASAGCSEGLLYKLFPTKLALFAAVLASRQGDVRDRIDQLNVEFAGVEDPLLRAHMVLRRCLEDHELQMRSRLRAAAVTMVHEEPIRRELQSSVLATRAHWTSFVADAQARGYARRDVDAEQAGRTITSLLIAELLLVAIDPSEAGGKYDQLRTILELLRVPDGPVPPTGKEPA
jgi:AcrR family transcriptional regulator